MTMRKLIEELKDLRDDYPLRLRVATVSAVVVNGAATTLTINFGGSDIPGVVYLDSYATPAAGDSVAVLQQGSNLLVIGRPHA